MIMLYYSVIKSRQQFAKGKNMNKIYIIGDSVMKGIVYSESNNKYSFSSEMKFSELISEGYEVCNYSKMGATIDKGYSILQKKLTGDHSGDIVLFGYGGNDCNFEWKNISDDNSRDYDPYTPLDRFEETYKKCIDYAKSLGAKVMLASLVPLDDHKFMGWICRGLSYENILSWLGDESMLYRWHESYNVKVRQIAAETGCEVIDVRTPFLSTHSFKDLICADGIHPTNEGYRIIENSIVKAIERVRVPQGA